jgi:hypothetical protein
MGERKRKLKEVVGRSRYAEKTHRPHPIASKIQPRPTPWDF